MPYDPFQPDTGLKEDFDGVIESALFRQNDQAAWQLQLVIHADDGEDVTPTFNLGAKSGVVSYDGGETISPPRPNFKFNQNVGFSKMMKTYMAVPGAADVLYDRSNKLYDGLGPFHANLWVGLRFHWDVIMDLEGRRMDEDTKEFKKVPGGVAVMVPTEFLGVATTTSATPTLMDFADLEQVASIAKTSGSWKEFAEAVSQIKDAHGQPLAKNPQFAAQLGDVGWYESLKVGK